MSRLLPLLLVPMLGLAVPAQAADLATIGCVGDKIDAATREAVEQDVTRNLGQTGQKNSYSSPVIEAMKAAAAACAKANGWGAGAERPAILYTLAKLSLPVAEKTATERGLDPAALEGVWLNLPEETRNKPLTTESYRELADAAIPEGDQRTRENGALLRTFFEFQSILQYASLDFAAA
jgi:hypothetical protein